MPGFVPRVSLPFFNSKEWGEKSQLRLLAQVIYFLQNFTSIKKKREKMWGHGLGWGSYISGNVNV
jgi:hypothetical protein